ncbi:copper resistance CopC family protein [Leekyejoonella antrihumi]|uniref:Copper resistance protein CopC n=1 Tax=Leekyejoonella antrihumi TaxID=1660198 RepID=A0A563DWJ4_9MICO|nr:copper resistance CopC family protein [Leekyejoonella antrihumi]TWP34575.1 copper resistance protein CopC [Leekyejoonella antrihumi]
MIRRLLALVTALFATCLWLSITPQALAHDVLISTSPADGSRVGHTPSKIVLTFDNPAIATGTVLKVTGPSGDVTEGKPTLLNHSVSQAIRPGSAAGTYTVDWRITSVDGHPVSGKFTFTSRAAGIGAPSPRASTASVAASKTASATAGGSGSTSPWVYVGVVAVVLALAGGLLVGRRRVRR